MLPGLLSITFRSLAAERIIALAAEAKLASIEWGGDVHVPHGDTAVAASLRRQCDAAGLTISAYGSYYRAGVSEAQGKRGGQGGQGGQGLPFAAVLDTAMALGTDTVRVWAGNVDVADASAEQRQAVVEDLQRICPLAAAVGITLSLEFHGGTLANGAAATLRLIGEVAQPNLFTYWQPAVAMDENGCAAELRKVLPHLHNLHVFHWWPDSNHRRPLTEGFARWQHYLAIAATAHVPRHASLEFVQNDSIDQFRDDAKTLLRLLPR